MVAGEESRVPGTFSADAVPTLLETGAYTVVWAPIHATSPILLDINSQPGPAYYGIKMLHQIAKPGDVFGDNVAVGHPGVHAVKKRDGGWACC